MVRHLCHTVVSAVTHTIEEESRYMVYMRNLPEEPSVMWCDNGQTVLGVNGKQRETRGWELYVIYTNTFLSCPRTGQAHIHSTEVKENASVSDSGSVQHFRLRYSVHVNFEIGHNHFIVRGCAIVAFSRVGGNGVPNSCPGGRAPGGP